MCMNICGMECAESMYETFISGGVLTEFEHYEPLSLPVGVLARTHFYTMLLPSLCISEVIQGCSPLQLHPLCHANSIHCVFMLF